MEIDMKPISMDARLEYVRYISENQQKNTKKYPWGIAIASCLIIAGLYVAVINFRNRGK